jgi:hypothetical protein
MGSVHERIILKPILEREIKCGGFSRIQVAHNRVEGRVFVNTAMKLQIS